MTTSTNRDSSERSHHSRGLWSMRVSGNWRIVFRFVAGEALDVDWSTIIEEGTRMTCRGMPLTHPGASIRDSMEAMGWTVTECARQLGTPRENLSRLLNGHIGISPTMAIALERIGWSNARFWLRRQAYFDLDQELRRQTAA